MCVRVCVCVAVQRAEAYLDERWNRERKRERERGWGGKGERKGVEGKGKRAFKGNSSILPFPATYSHSYFI